MMKGMKKEPLITVTKQRRNGMVEEVKKYFLKERDEEIGDLAAGLVFDFILEKMGPEFYNQGVDDSYNYMKDAADDLLSIRK